MLTELQRHFAAADAEGGPSSHAAARRRRRRAPSFPTPRCRAPIAAGHLDKTRAKRRGLLGYLLHIYVVLRVGLFCGT